MDEASWHDWTTVETKQIASPSPRASPSRKSWALLLPAEDVIAEAQAVVLVNIDKPGTLLVTNFRLLFVLDEQICSLGTIPLAAIEKFSKQQAVRRSRAAAHRLLQIVGKDMRTIVFGFRLHGKQRRHVHEVLQRLTKPARLWDLYAFSPDWAKTCAGIDPDPRSRLQSEFKRIISHYQHYWTLSDVNSDYLLCPTYPSLLVMPKSVSNEEIQHGADFRARCRLPTLSWQHPGNGAVLARSSQPMIGIMMNSRSNADEKLVAALCGPRKSHLQQRKLYIADARPRKNALANGALGGGSESSANYSQCEVVFLGIDNIHAMRESLSRLREYLDVFGAASSDGSSSLLRGGGSIWGGGNFSSTAAAVSAIGDSGWLTHIHSLLAGAAWIAARIAQGASVLVHCSDGWDRTSQLVALAQVMLEPYYRTFEGLQALIEKDWLAFGHPFADRLGMPTITSNSDSIRSISASPMRAAPGANVSLQSTGASSDNSPIFLQWVDCISHLLRLYPRSFQYSSAYLVDLVDSALSGRFGNFLCNSEKERVQAAIGESACIWTHFRRIYSGQGQSHKYYNVFYTPKSSTSMLLPPPATLAASLWPEYYLRWTFHPDKSLGKAIDEDIQEEVRMMYQRVSSSEEGKSNAEDKIENLKSMIRELQNKLEGEERGRAEAVAEANRARKESAFIKQAVETLGCDISFEEVVDQYQRRQWHEDEGEDGDRNMAVSVCLRPGFDMLARSEMQMQMQMRRGVAEKESCSWPQAGCPRSESSMDGLCVDYQAFERLSMDDLYFHSPGVT